MKRLMALVLVGAMSLALFGCGKKDTGRNKDRDEDDSPKATAEEVSDTNYLDVGVGFRQRGGKVVFIVKSDLELSESAWLGFIPGTKGYKDEGEADEYDVLYAYYNSDREASEDYIFEFQDDQIEALDDGKYTIVLCDDDDEGRVVLYMPAVIEGSTVTCDFVKVVIN